MTSADGLDRRLRVTGFRLLWEDGMPVSVDRLAKRMQADPQAVLDRAQAMDRRGLVRVDAKTNVVGAAGLSVVPTAHEVEAGGRRFWTWCAYDALGILAAMELSGRISTHSPATGARIEVEVRDGRPEPGEVVLFLAHASRSTSGYRDWCPLVNLFEDRSAAASWAAANVFPGEILELAAAATRGALAWGPLVGQR